MVENECLFILVIIDELYFLMSIYILQLYSYHLILQDFFYYYFESIFWLFDYISFPSTYFNFLLILLFGIIILTLIYEFCDEMSYCVMIKMILDNHSEILFLRLFIFIFDVLDVLKFFIHNHNHIIFNIFFVFDYKYYFFNEYYYILFILFFQLYNLTF